MSTPSTNDDQGESSAVCTPASNYPVTSIESPGGPVEYGTHSSPDPLPTPTEPIWQRASVRAQRYQVMSEEDPWKFCVDAMSKHDEDQVRAWKEELNNLLIFVGTLFLFF